ncbi:MAG: HAD family phosphatase [Isosphaeraceae bacterium]
MTDTHPAGDRPLAVVFDLDGLMFNTEALFARVASEMLADRGKEFTPEIMRAMIGRRAAEASGAFRRLTGLEEPEEVLLGELKQRFYAVMDTAVHPTPGLFHLLARLEALGLPRAVATSSRREYAEGMISRHGLMPHFSFVLTGEDVSRGKPDPEVYLLAATRLGIEPRRMLVLEDSPAGLAAAKAAGAFAVGVPHEHSPGEGLLAADLIVARLDAPELLAILGPEGDPNVDRS